MGRMSVGDGGLDGEGRSSRVVAERARVYVHVRACVCTARRTHREAALARDGRTHLRAREAKPLRARGRRGGRERARGVINFEPVKTAPVGYERLMERRAK